MPPPPKPSLRTLLVLGRASNLPTVWSNCLAGWLLGGEGGSLWALFRVITGGSLLYIAGMYLNDACDAAFDRQHRRERPIPSGAIGEATVWKLGLAMMVGGWAILASLGWVTAALGLFLVISIVVYDVLHKALSFSPVLMSACRFFLFLAAASAGPKGVTGLALWTAIALSGWIIGLSYVARRESTKSPMRHWPLAVLTFPLILAYLANAGDWRYRALFIGLLLSAWALFCLRHVLVEANRNLGLTVAGLLAGICLVDWLAVAPPPGLGLVFLLLFGAALAAQRLIPAT